MYFCVYKLKQKKDNDNKDVKSRLWSSQIWQAAAAAAYGPHSLPCFGSPFLGFHPATNRYTRSSTSITKAKKIQNDSQIK
ncbi:hypothetical protein DERF_001404 [Dermatophagoides farinae]|uniref:Uncharacterized protein n=1 Tax=Dermatophagoides farinae TaxID=6954 RepID=A0A922I9F1_DERFA|nr:hypothetical protein DERF_001404 [Dermatophagoides farinae]